MRMSHRLGMRQNIDVFSEDRKSSPREESHVSAAGGGEECGAPGTRRHGLGDSTRQCSLKAFSNFAACREYAILCAQTPNIALSDERFGCLEKPLFGGHSLPP